MLIVLQTIEARLVSERVCGLLTEHLPPDVGLCPIHDCVLVPDGYQEAAIDTFRDVADELGFPLAVELKRA